MTPAAAEAIRQKLPEFLLAEHAHTTEALLRNEEAGEKRATFFVSIAGAAAAVFAFAFGGEDAIVSRQNVPVAAAGAALLLLLLGLLTARRLIERHIVTDRYIFALRSLRRAFLTREDAVDFPNAFFKLYEPIEPRTVRVLGPGKGGWLQTIALTNAVLAALAVAAAARAASPAWDWRPGALAALAALAMTWTAQMLYARQKLAANADDLIACERRAAEDRST